MRELDLTKLSEDFRVALVVVMDNATYVGQEVQVPKVDFERMMECALRAGYQPYRELGQEG